MKDNFIEIKKPLNQDFDLKFDGQEHNLSSGKNIINKGQFSPNISFYFRDDRPLIDVPVLIKFSQFIQPLPDRIRQDESNFWEVLTEDKKTLIRLSKHENNRIFYCDMPLLIEFVRECISNIKRTLAQNSKFHQAYLNDFGHTDSEYDRLIGKRKKLDFFLDLFSNHEWIYKQINTERFFLDHGPFSQELWDGGDNLFDSQIPLSEFQDTDFVKSMRNQFGFFLYENGYRIILHKEDFPHVFSDQINDECISFYDILEIIIGSFEEKHRIDPSRYLSLPSLENIYYLPSIKGSNERSYHSKDKHELNLLFKEYFDKTKSDKDLAKQLNHLKSKWLNKFGLADLLMERDDRLDANYYTINGISNVDTGYGMTQLIAIILRILCIGNPANISDARFRENILILEEPEANLHPKFQSMLADLFVEAADIFNIQFIVETHSEYLIRKLQFLTAKKQIKIETSSEIGLRELSSRPASKLLNTEDVVIYYFQDPNNIPKGEKQVKKIEILEDGSLSDDFGPGFFDEAANWELELIRLKNSKNRNN